MQHRVRLRPTAAEVPAHTLAVARSSAREVPKPGQAESAARASTVKGVRGDLGEGREKQRSGATVECREIPMQTAATASTPSVGPLTALEFWQSLLSRCRG